MPVPVPALVTVSLVICAEEEDKLKLAVQICGLFKVTVAAVVEPLQFPLQPVKVESTLGTAVNVTLLPEV